MDQADREMFDDLDDDSYCTAMCTAYGTFYGADEASYMNDLIVCEDDAVWKRTPDSHRWAAGNSSFSFVRGHDDEIIDLRPSAGPKKA